MSSGSEKVIFSPQPLLYGKLLTFVQELIFPGIFSTAEYLVAPYWFYMVTYMSPPGSTCTRPEQDDLPCSCSMYTGIPSVLWGSVLSRVSFAAETDKMSCICFFTSFHPSQLPFLPGKELALYPAQPCSCTYMSLSTWCNFTYGLSLEDSSEWSWVGNTHSSLFHCVHSGVDTK